MLNASLFADNEAVQCSSVFIIYCECIVTKLLKHSSVPENLCTISLTKLKLGWVVFEFMSLFLGKWCQIECRSQSLNMDLCMGF